MTPAAGDLHPILALRERALECATAFAANGGSFVEAVRPAWRFALDTGLIAHLGQNAVAAIILGAFNFPATSQRRH
jgi:hypothetical protein